jgi:hypothetical protein
MSAERRFLASVLRTGDREAGGEVWACNLLDDYLPVAQAAALSSLAFQACTRTLASRL